MEPHERLKAVRESLDMTQTELARKIQVAVSSLSSAETGQNGITPRILFPLKIMYRVNPDWVIKGEGTMFYERPTVDGIPDHILDNPKATRDFIIKLQKELAELRGENDRCKKIIDRLVTQ